MGNSLGENEIEFYWESRCRQKCIHIISEKESGKFIGINSFGIRLRHELFDKWLREGKTTDYVIQNIQGANFDPEFTKDFSKEIVKVWEGLLV